MGYDDEAERSRNRRSRARQPVKRMGDREIEQRRYREPGHSQPGLNLTHSERMAAADRIMTGLDRRKRAGGRSAEEKNRSRRSRKADAEESRRRTVEFTVPLPEKRQKEEKERL